jgi:hypothetical protein
VRPAEESATPSRAEVLHRAAEVCDPRGTEEASAFLLERFGDRDEPVTAVPNLTAGLLEAKGAIDPQDEDPVAVMAVAVAIYLAHRRTQLDTGRVELLRLAVRAEFDGRPPELVAGWLAGRGVER